MVEAVIKGCSSAFQDIRLRTKTTTKRMARMSALKSNDADDDIEKRVETSW